MGARVVRIETSRCGEGAKWIAEAFNLRLEPVCAGGMGCYFVQKGRMFGHTEVDGGSI